MTPLSPLDRFLLFATVGGMFASLAFYAAARTAKYWKAPFVRFARASRTLQAIVLAGLLAVTALGGGKTNDALRLPPRIVRTIPAEVLPAWFVAMGYPATDADASGIPDCWEKWTHTRGFASDADPDGDGLTNLAEFEAQTDPIRADTDGDGIDDATELAGLAAGVPDLDPLAPATFAADEPDTDGDGIPDLWESSTEWVYQGVDPNGFPAGPDIPEAGAGNYDVRIAVSSTRHARLSWGDGDDEAMLLPPCTNLALRLRLGADDVKTLALSPSPNTSTNPVGTWRGAVVADWDERRGLPTEDDRVAVPDGTMVDRSERESVSVEAWMPQPALRSGSPTQGRRRESPEITFTPRKLKLVPLEGFCRTHGPDPLIQVVATNAAPPYVWTEGGVDTVTEQNTYRAHYAFPDGHFEVSCRWQDRHSSLFVSDSVQCDPNNCRPGLTNFVGAGWTSTHNPTNASDHAPGITEEDVVFGPLCPVAHDVNVKLGWTHDTAILWIRNLIRILAGDDAFDRFDHCIAVSWSEDGVIDLSLFLDETTSRYRERLSFRVNGVDSSGSLSLEETVPDVLYPDVYVVDLMLSGSSRPLDTFVLTIYNERELFEFADWVVQYADTSWTEQLPRPSKTKPNGETANWYAPKAPGTYMHHDAAFEIRSKPVAGGHGHQATYDGVGKLIEDGTIACGTADYVSPESLWDGSMKAHREADVKPYIKALHLDGNPGHPDNGSGLFSETVPSRLTQPCLHQDYYLRQYLNKRPSFPTGVLEQ